MTTPVPSQPADFPAELFWDVDPETLDLVAHRTFIIERILTMGRPIEIRWLLSTYTESEIRDVVCRSRRLDRRTANFWAIHLEIPLEEVRCFQNPPPLPFTGQ